MCALWKPAIFPTRPTPVTLRFEDPASAFEALVGFEFTPAYWKAPLHHKTPFEEGWIVVRIEEQLVIVEARVCPMYIDSKSLLQIDTFVADPYKPPDCSINVHQTLDDWREQFPDSLVREVTRASTVTLATPSALVSDGPPYFVSLDILKNLVDTSHFFFEELRAMREKAIPWPPQDFMDMEAVCGFVAHTKIFPKVHLYAQRQLERAARAGRAPAEIARAQSFVKKLQRIGDAAYAEWSASNDLRDGKKRRSFMKKNGVPPPKVIYDEESWLEQMRTECPGFSDWVYRGAIFDYMLWKM